MGRGGMLLWMPLLNFALVYLIGGLLVNAEAWGLHLGTTEHVGAHIKMRFYRGHDHLDA